MSTVLKKWEYFEHNTARLQCSFIHNHLLDDGMIRSSHLSEPASPSTRSTPATSAWDVLILPPSTLEAYPSMHVITDFDVIGSNFVAVSNQGMFAVTINRFNNTNLSSQQMTDLSEQGKYLHHQMGCQPYCKRTGSHLSCIVQIT